MNQEHDGKAAETVLERVNWDALHDFVAEHRAAEARGTHAWPEIGEQVQQETPLLADLAGLAEPAGA